MDQTWVAPTVERTEPARIATERESLEQWLDYQRATLLTKCAGLTGDQLVLRSALPSSLSLLGLVRHMVEVERAWFRNRAGQQDLAYEYCTDDNENGDFDDLDPARAEADLATFRREVVAARTAVVDMGLDDVVHRNSRDKRPERTWDLRWIYVHMIEEYARHNGHADLIRERIDGSTGD